MVYNAQQMFTTRMVWMAVNGEAVETGNEWSYSETMNYQDTP